jgi:hypothetical protein
VITQLSVKTDRAIAILGFVRVVLFGGAGSVLVDLTRLVHHGHLGNLIHVMFFVALAVQCLMYWGIARTNRVALFVGLAWPLCALCPLLLGEYWALRAGQIGWAIDVSISLYCIARVIGLSRPARFPVDTREPSQNLDAVTVATNEARYDPVP